MNTAILVYILAPGVVGFNCVFIFAEGVGFHKDCRYSINSLIGIMNYTLDKEGGTLEM